MKTEYINSFLQGTQSVIRDICGETTNLGRLYEKGLPYETDQVNVSIGIGGQLKGHAIFEMDVDSAAYIASKFIGMAVEELDELSQSAVSEIMNMISGTVASNFFAMGLNIDITTPMLKLNAGSDDFGFIQPEQRIMCLPLRFKNGRAFNVNVVL